MFWRSVIAVAAMLAALQLVTAADAAKKQARSRSAPSGRAETPSLDGRVLGYPRTCWSSTFVYDIDGTPVGPYCH